MIWHYLEGNEQRGPVTDADLDALAQSGKVGNDTLVWREGMAEWKPYSQARGPIAGGAAAPIGLRMAPPGQGICGECGQAFPLDQVIHHGNVFICAGCKPAFLQKLKEGVALSGTMAYAGFWVRFLAKFVDGIIVEAVILPLTFYIQGAPGAAPPNISKTMITFPISIVLGMIYYTFFVGKFAATPGKMATKLRIVNPDGSKVSYGKACAPYFAAEWVSGCFTLGIGYLMIAWDDEKRALHDRICSTRVIRRGP